MTFSSGGYTMSINVSLYITIKGEERMYSRILYLMKSIVLSGKVAITSQGKFLLKLELLSNSRIRIYQEISSLDLFQR
jgi:hypothetical protein